MERFIDREKKLKRSDLILPVYYVGSPVLDDDAKRAKDKLAQEIAKHQYADWRDLRFEPFTSPQVGKVFAQVAVQIRAALERAYPQKTAAKKSVAGKKRNSPSKKKTIKASQSDSESSAPSSQVAQSEVTGGGTTQRPSVKTEPPTIIVDPLHRGDCTTITEAIAKANAGDKILIRPGLYPEGLVIDKPLEIVGDGPLGEVVIQVSGKHTVLFKTTMGRISNLSLRQTGGGKWYCVNIAQGRLELEGCDITSQSLACVGIHDGADPRLRRNRIHDGKAAGVYINGNGQGTLEDNDIFGNAHSGVQIATGSNPVLRRNRIHDGKESGVIVSENGQGMLEDNDIFGNAYSGVEVKTGGNPVLRRNRIHDGKKSGVFIHDNGQGTLEDNDIFGNATSGVVIQEDGNPTLRNNRINKNVFYAIHIINGGAGTFEGNDLRDNEKGAWSVSADSEPKIKRARNQE